MLLGCCHCGETPPSESASASLSQSASSGDPAPISEVTNNCARENCIGNVFAKRYTLSFGYSQTARCGPRYSAGTYTLGFVGNIGDICVFRTSISGVNWSGGVCNDAAAALATLGFYNDAISTPTAAGFFRYILSIYSAENGVDSGRILYYSSNLTNVSILSGSPYSPINCLSGFSLPLVSSSTVANNFHSTVTGLSGGVAAVPTTVSLVPAP